MIVVDTSALIAILLDEPEAAQFAACLSLPVAISIGAPTYFETLLVAVAKKEAMGRADVDLLIDRFEMVVLPWTRELAEEAIEAHSRFGRGRDQAALNFGDCMAYALAKSLDAPLLYKGNDFALTDIRSAV